MKNLPLKLLIRTVSVCLLFSVTMACAIIPGMDPSGNPGATTQVVSTDLPSPTSASPLPTRDQPLPTKTPKPSPTIPPNHGAVLFETAGVVRSFDLNTASISDVIALPTSDILGITLSPDLATLAYSLSDGLYMVDLASGAPVFSMSPEPGEILAPRQFNPRSLPGRSQVLVSRKNGDIFTFSILNQAPEPGWNQLPPPPNGESYGCDTGAAWSPTGERIAVTGLGYGIKCNVNPGLTLISVRRGASFALLNRQIPSGLDNDAIVTAGARTPAWSPDSKYLYFSQDEAATSPLQFFSRLYRISEDGIEVVQISENNRGVAAFPFSPKNELLFYALSGDNPQTDGIYLFNLVDKTSQLVIKGAGYCPLDTSSDGLLLLFGRNCTETGGSNELRIINLQNSQVQTLFRSTDGRPIQYLGWKE
jgi:hypothetical protein